MSIDYIMDGEHDEPTNTPDSSSHSDSSDSESPFSESETIMPSVMEPDVSLDEMLSLACRQGKLDIVQLLLQSGAHVNHRNKAGNTPLLEACSQGHVSVANYLLDNGSKIDAPTESTLDSALTWACTLGNLNIVEALLSKSADVEHRTKDGCTALMFACLAGHCDVAERLLDANSEINVESDSNKDSPLTFACWKGHFDVVTLLLKRNANIEHRTKEGFSPLMFAALGGHTKVARKLLETNAEVNVPSGSNNDIPLTSACWKGHQDVVKLLLEFNSSIEHRTKDGCTPLMLAAREGHLKVAELLLKNNAEVNVPSGSENNIPLTLACWKGHWEVVQLLLDYESDIEHRNKAGCTPLMLAAREGHYETTILLLERNSKVNVPSGSNDDTPLTLACWKGHKEVVMLLLDSKSNIDHQTKTGCTPLMEATREGHHNVAEILLDHNADVELPDNYGQSPLFMACWKGHKDVAKLLLQKGAYRDCRTKTGITPLFQACRENHVSIVELLLTHGAGVNNPFPNSRENPLTLCAEKGHKRLVDLLLSKGASLDCRTKKGCTPEFLACKEGHIDIAQMLAEHGANLETPDCRGNTPIMAAYKNGHVAIVSWLIKYVHHLPSDELCHKILMSSVDDKEKEIIVQRRSKCLAVIQETKKKRELLALRNAQNLVQELDDEKNREEKKKKKKAAKRRDKNSKRKRNRESEKELVVKMNGLLTDPHLQQDDEEEYLEDDEENKDNLAPTENREYTDEKPEIVDTTTNDVTTRLLVQEKLVDMTSTKSSSRKKSRKKSDRKKHSKEEVLKISDPENRPKSGEVSLIFNDHPLKTFAETTATVTTTSVTSRDLQPAAAARYEKVMSLLTHNDSPASGTTSNTIRRTTADNTSEITTTRLSKPTVVVEPVVTSTIAMSSSSSCTTTPADTRSQRTQVASTDYVEDDWDEESQEETFDKVSYSRSDSNSAHSTSSVSRNSSFDEFKDSDWKEMTRSSNCGTSHTKKCDVPQEKGTSQDVNVKDQDESGGQITINKPPGNTIPLERVISIKGLPQCAEKARLMVTCALNTPTLNLAESPIPISAVAALKPPTNPVVTSLANQKVVAQSAAVPSTETKKPSRPIGRIPTADVPVTPLLSYSKVATGAVSLEEIGKQLKAQQQSKEQHDSAKIVKRITSSEQRKHSQDSSPRSLVSAEHFASRDFSYFTNSDSSRLSSNQHLSSERSKGMQPFGESKRAPNKENGPWKSNESTYDRSRSISWTGQPHADLLAESDGPGNRSMSTEAITDRQGVAVSPWTMLQSDEHVFEDNGWSHKTKTDDSLPSGNEVWELSSSPTSSVSSSKVELNNILDNDSGLSSSNPLGPTPPSMQSDSRMSLQEQPYLDTGTDNSAWLQSRGAYSAPSSPALQRNGETKSGTNSPKPKNIRSHPSMDELNNSRPWKKYPETSSWPQRPSSPTQPRGNRDRNDVTRDTNHDSGLSSPHTLLEKRKISLDNKDPVLSRPLSMQWPVERSTNNPTKKWTAERFQDVNKLSDLMQHLSLEKYAGKFEENMVSLEKLLSLNEKDLQSFGIPKGPRLKILKACDLLRSQKPFPQPSQVAPHRSLIETPVVPSSQPFFQPPLTTVQQHQFPSDNLYQKHVPFSAPFGYTDLLSYNVQQEQQQPFNVIIPNNHQPFLHNMQQQPFPAHPQNLFNTTDRISTLPPPQLTNHHNGEGFQSHQMLYPDNQAFYFYPPP